MPASHRHLVPLNLVLAFLALAGCAHASQPAKAFPQFAGRKSNLEHVKLLCQVCVWQNIEGDVEQVLLDESSALGSEVERRMKDALVAKGYPVDGSAFVSTCFLLSKWTRSPSDTTAVPPRDPTGVFSAPFILDTTLLRNSAIVNAWIGLLHGLNDLDYGDLPWRGLTATMGRRRYEPKPGESPAFLTEAVVLCDSLGGGAIAVLRLEFAALDERSRGHTLEPIRHLNLLEKLTGGFLRPRTTLGLTLVDGKSGEVLWDDRQFNSGPYDRKVIEQMMAKIIEKLP